MRLDVGTVLVQWAAGGLAFCWVTTRRREVGLGYGWLLRIVYGSLAAIGVAASVAEGDSGAAHAVFVAGTVGLVVATAVALAVSVLRRSSGVSGQRAARAARRERVAAMLHERAEVPSTPAPHDTPGREFPPALDLAAPVGGLVALLGAASLAGGPYALALVRLVAGAVLLGVVSDAMLLGHWYLVQPGLARDPIKELVRGLALAWPVEVAAYLWPTGMVSVLTGRIDDGYGGMLGWIWLTCACSTVVLAGVTWAALRERSYSAVMAATGLLYLAILTAFGTDLVARATLTH